MRACIFSPTRNNSFLATTDRSTTCSISKWLPWTFLCLRSESCAGGFPAPNGTIHRWHCCALVKSSQTQKKKTNFMRYFNGRFRYGRHHERRMAKGTWKILDSKMNSARVYAVATIKFNRSWKISSEEVCSTWILCSSWHHITRFMYLISGRWTGKNHMYI